MAFADTSTRFVMEGFGEQEVYFLEAVSAGDPVAYSSTGFVPADSNNSLPMQFIAANDYGATSSGSVYAAAVVSGFTGGTPGGLLYLSDTAGSYSDSTGSVSQVVGVLYSATVAFIQARTSA